MFEQARAHFESVLEEIESAGLYKHERIISSAQGASIDVLAGPGAKRRLEQCVQY